MPVKASRTLHPPVPLRPEDRERISVAKNSSACCASHNRCPATETRSHSPTRPPEAERFIYGHTTPNRAMASQRLNCTSCACASKAAAIQTGGDGYPPRACVCRVFLPSDSEDVRTFLARGITRRNFSFLSFRRRCEKFKTMPKLRHNLTRCPSLFPTTPLI